MKNFYSNVFTARNNGDNKKSLPPFQVCGNDALTKRTLPHNIRASYFQVRNPVLSDSTIQTTKYLYILKVTDYL